MEAFAAYLSHTDHELGRLLDRLAEMGELDDTLTVVLSDNGASSEGGPTGSLNDVRVWNALPRTVEQPDAVERGERKLPVGTAFTNRTIRYLAEPFFPEAIDGSPPGPYSILNDGGTDPTTGRQIGPPLPASAFQSVLGFDSFNPQSNFHQAAFYQNQDGIVFFPGSAPLLLLKSHFRGDIGRAPG